MDWETVLQSIDELVFKQTRKHLDSLQVEILKGVLNGQKYPEIAKQYKCTKGHVKDEAYKLWQVLSKTFGEDVNRSNFCATVQRLGFANSQYQMIGNPVQIGNLNLCPNSEPARLEKGDEGNPELNQDKTRTGGDNSASAPLRDSASAPLRERTVETLLRETKLNSLYKLIELGLSAEQIAEALDLPLDEVREAME
jgi:DNA-directed RNA polymerase specialized sigma24 family protein